MFVQGRGPAGWVLLVLLVVVVVVLVVVVGVMMKARCKKKKKKIVCMWQACVCACVCEEEDLVRVRSGPVTCCSVGGEYVPRHTGRACASHAGGKIRASFSAGQ